MPVPIAFSLLEPLTTPSTIRQPFPKTDISPDARSLSYTTLSKTDWWRTPHEARFSGPVLAMPISTKVLHSAKGWSAGVELGGAWAQEFDQACLILYHKTDQWLKTGVEYAHGHASISVVSTHPYSDWSLFPSPLPLSSTLKLKLSYNPFKGIAIFAFLPSPANTEGSEWVLIREVRHWPLPASSGEEVFVGVGGCSPHPFNEEGEKEGCKVTFGKFWVEEGEV